MNIGDIMGSQTPQPTGLGPVGDAQSQLGKDDFLKLLLQQLKNQDPLKPMEDREFITQLAQFRTLEQMQETNDNLQALLDYQHLSLAGSLIGKTVEATADGEPVIGTVSEVRLANNEVRLSVDGTDVELSRVTRIVQSGADSGSSQD